MTIEQLLKLKEKVGKHVFGQLLAAKDGHTTVSETSKRSRKNFKRENKNRPREMSSKRPSYDRTPVFAVKKNEEVSFVIWSINVRRLFIASFLLSHSPAEIHAMKSQVGSLTSESSTNRTSSWTMFDIKRRASWKRNYVKLKTTKKRKNWVIWSLGSKIRTEWSQPRFTSKRWPISWRLRWKKLPDGSISIEVRILYALCTISTKYQLIHFRATQERRACREVQEPQENGRPGQIYGKEAQKERWQRSQEASVLVLNNSRIVLSFNHCILRTFY